MALRFLADHCVPNSVIQSLREANHEGKLMVVEVDRIRIRE